jgi:hypothetical protein
MVILCTITFIHVKGMLTSVRSRGAGGGRADTGAAEVVGGRLPERLAPVPHGFVRQQPAAGHERCDVPVAEASRLMRGAHLS